MTETTQIEQPVQVTETAQPQDNSVAIANALWGEAPVVQSTPEAAAATTTTQEQATAASTATTAAVEEPEVISPEEWLKREFEFDNIDTFKNEWGELRKLKEQPPKVEEVKWANEESKQLHDLIREGKRDEVRRVLNQQAELERLEKYDINDAAQAREIIKANLQFKYKDLDPKQIDRLYERQYALPQQPQQTLDQSDDDYAQSVAAWQRQVQEREMDIMIDAKIAQPELANYKKQIVFPDTPIVNAPAQQGPTQEDLAAQQAFRESFVQKLGTDYRNFKGYNTIAKDGEVELPISYSLNDDEKLAFNPIVQKAVDDIQGFLDNDLGWWDEKAKSFNINKMQEDLYLLKNKDKIFQKIAGESAAQRFQHHLKTSNNINLKGVNGQLDIPIPAVKLDEKARNQQVAEAMWSI
jgi:hypothetical protein